MIGEPGPGGLYTSQGLMTPGDLAEHRADTDWDARPHVPQEGECAHGRLWGDDCEDCHRPLMADEAREAINDPSSPIYLTEEDCRRALCELLGRGTVQEGVMDAFLAAIENRLQDRQRQEAQEALDAYAAREAAAVQWEVTGHA